MKTVFEQQLNTIAQAKYAEAAAIPFGPTSGRRVELAGMSTEKIKPAVIAQLVDIGRRLGTDFLVNTPALVLEQFAVTAMARDHDTAGMIKSLINSFMAAYITPETSSDAFDHLLGLEQLRATVATARSLKQAAPEPASPIHQLRAYQVGDQDIVAAYDPAGAIQVLTQFNGELADTYELSDVTLASDALLDNRLAFEPDDRLYILLDKSLREEMAELSEPAYLHGWE